MTLWSLLSLLVAGGGETTVSARRTADFDDVRLVVDVAAAPEEALLRVPGVALSREGGPLSASRPLVRGLSDSRLQLSVLGLPFGDPAAGAIDAGLLPWVLGGVDVDVGAGAALGGSLAVPRPAPGLQAAVIVGELSTLMLQARAVQASADGVVGVATSLGSSRGDFVFRADDALGTPGPLLRRVNNQQERGSALLFGSTHIDDVTVRGAGVVSAHEGGIPGFATAPLTKLRGRRRLGSGGLGLAWKPPGATGEPQLLADVAASAQGSERATTFGSFDDDDASSLYGSRLGARALLRLLAPAGAAPPPWSVEGGVDVVGTTLLGLGGADVAQRLEAALQGALHARVDCGSLATHVDVDASLRGVDDLPSLAWLPTGSLRLGLFDQGGQLGGFVGVTRAARPATLDERFAPRGFVLANPSLSAESASEVEAGVVIALPAVWVRLVAHASVIDDAIVIVNRSAFAVVPQNTGPATRAGLDLGARLAPTALLSFDVSASVLGSEVKATQAPLPGAPPLLLSLRSRLGDDSLHVDISTQSRGPAASTIFGTLLSPGFTLVDLAVRLPLAENLGLGLSLHNALDVLGARDTNLIPLPGRLLFVSLEVKA